jgi:hypothetical protein
MIKKLAFLIALPLALLACNRAPRTLPDQLTGFWTAEGTRFNGRFMELSKAYVIIGAGEQGSPGVQTIDRVESLPDGGTTLYTIYSTTQSGLHDQFTITFDPHNNGEIRLKNAGDVVWKRLKEKP